MDIKNIIREKRLELNLTYEELGNMIGVGKSTVRKWETGMIENIRRDNIVALAKALNISPALIMGWDIKEDETIAIEVLKQNELINEFNKLNSIGKEEAIKRVSELTEINKYIDAKENNVTELITSAKKEPKSLQDLNPTILAAHDDDLTDEEKIEVDRRILEMLKKR